MAASGRGDVAVADDRDPAHRPDHGADAGEVHRAAETLGARPAVHEDRGHPGVLQHAGEIGRGEIFVVPAEAHLGGDGDFHRLDHAADERGGLVKLGHHRRAAADPDHLAHGAAHVDVDRGVAEGFELQGGVAHLPRHAAEQLHGERPVGGARLDELEGLALALESERALTRSVVAQSSPPSSRSVSRMGRLV